MKRSIGSVELGGAETSDNEDAGLVLVADRPAKAESWKFQDGNTLAISGTYDTADVSLFMPFDALRLTEDGAAATVTWSIQARPGSKPVIVVSGTGTLSVKGIINAVVTGDITVSTTAGVLQAATTLAAGTYFLEV